MIADEVLIASIAGFVHDFGKVLEPAAIPLGAAQTALEPIVCPVDSFGRPTHRYVLWTAKALERAPCDWGGLDRDAVFRAACYHQRPSSGKIMEHLVTRADRLAIGNDRWQPPDEEAQRRVTGLLSPLAGLGNRTVQESGPVFLATASGRSAAAGWLPARASTPDEYARACEEISGSFINELGAISGPPAWCLEQLNAIASTHLAAIPASRAWSKSPDTSLYDHSRAVAAFAACLSAQHIESAFASDDAIDGRFALVTLRLKGIQTFIFRRVLSPDDPGSADKGRARELRARSFYASLLMNDAARTIAAAGGVPATNILINAGGSATVLVPGTPATYASVRQAASGLVDWFARWFGGVLRLEAGASESLSEHHFMAEAFPATMRALEESVVASRGHGVPDSIRSEAWKASGWVGDQPGLPSDRLADRLQEFGRRLPRAQAVRFLANDTGDLPLPRGSLSLMERDLGPSTEGCFALSRLKENARPVIAAAAYVPRVPPEQAPPVLSDESLRPGDPLPFNELAARSTDDDGLPVGGDMLGVLKADVDRLGYLFAYGLTGPDSRERSQASLGRFAAVSRAFDEFFKGFLDARLRTEFENIYTVFAGGDDLFLIGPWYDVARLARALHRWFDHFACNSQDSETPGGGTHRITFSAAVAFFKPQVPVRVLADVSDDLLERAKEGGRNRVAFGRAVLGWSEYQLAWDWHRDMLAFAGNGGGGGNGLIRQVLDIARAAQAARPSHAPAPLSSLKWRAQLSYMLARRPKHERQGPGLALYERLIRVTQEELAAVDVGAVLTLYRMRGERP